MINVLDIETFEKKNKVIPYCVCVILDNVEYTFYKCGNNNVIEEVIYLILQKSFFSFIEIYVHNLNFDGALIMEYLSFSRFSFKIKSLNTNLYWIKIEHLEKCVLFRCSFKIIPMSLKKIGVIENFPKSLFPYNFISEDTLSYIGVVPDKIYWNGYEYEDFIKNFEGDYDVKKESIKYCLNDVRLLRKCLINLLNVINQIDDKLINCSYSAPSMSHKIFFKLFNFRKIEKKSQKKVDIYARNSYKGGRTEVFGNVYDDEYIKYYDFPGMYGGCMKEKFHCGKYEIVTDFEINDVGFHTVDYKTNDDNIPILPSHSEKGKLLFTNGTGTGSFWFEELLYFVENGGIILKKHHSLRYEEYDEVFTDFVNYFERVREKGGYYKIFGKLMINSLYGSMGLKDEEYYNYVTFSTIEFEYILKTFDVFKFYSLNEVYVIIILKNYKFKNIFKKGRCDMNVSVRNVTYSSAIASKARIKLHKFMMEVEKDGGRVLYTDTDSVFAAYNINDRRKSIGDKKWIDFYDDGVFVSPKSYSVINDREEIVKIKGISFKEMKFEEFKKKFYEDESFGFDYQKINSKKDFILSQKSIVKKINFGGYDKRIFSKDKKETKPLETIQTYSE